MARIPLAEIPNAPMGGKPALANPQFPRDEVGGQAISQIREGYRDMMVDSRAASAMGTAMQNVGSDIVQTGNNLADATGYYARMVNAEATSQFLNNLTDLQGQMKQNLAGADPSMYPVIVKNTYQTKDGQLNPALFAGISDFGRRYVQGDAVRSASKDMAEYSLAAHLASLEQDEGRKLASMQTLINSGNFDDANSMNDSLLASRRIAPSQYASQKAAIEGARDNSTLMQAIAQDPVIMGQKLEKAFATGKPLPEIKNISIESYPRFAKAAEMAYSLQTTEKITTLASAIDSKATPTLPALRENPIFKTLDQKNKTALERRITNNNAGSAQSEALIKEGAFKLAAFPSTENPAREMLEMLTWATENLPDPHLDPIVEGLQKKVTEMSQNGGVLKLSSDLERYVANKTDVFASIGLFGEVPVKASGEAQSEDYGKKQNEIISQKMSLLEKFRKAGITNQRDADEFLNQQILGSQAKAALKSEAGFFKKTWRSMFPPDAPKPAGSPTPPPSSPKTSKADGFQPAVATWFGTSPDGTPDPEDNQKGKYAGAKTGDPNYMGASLSKAALAEHGIPEDKAGDYDVIVKKNDKQVRVPIADLGPAEWVEQQNGRTIDLTGAVHRSLGTKGKEQITYKVVPRYSADT